MHKTLRRNQLQRMAQRGELLFVGGWFFDDMTGQDTPDHRAAPMPVKYRAPGTPRSPDGTLDLDDHHFTSGSGTAYWSGPGLIHLSVHSNCSYDFITTAEYARRQATAAPVPAAA